MLGYRLILAGCFCFGVGACQGTDDDGGNSDSDSETDDSDSDTDTGDSDSDTDTGDSDSDTDAGDSDSDTDTGDSDSDTDTGDSDSDTDTGDSDSDTDTGNSHSGTDTSDSGEHCGELAEAACIADAACAPYDGWRLDAERNCVDQDSFAFCIPYYSGCNDLVMRAKDPGGTCWYLFSDCGLGERGWETEFTSDLADCPTYDTWESLAECT